MNKKAKARKSTKCKYQKCNKDIKKKLSYYRDGSYYCQKRHWYKQRDVVRKLQEKENEKSTTNKKNS